MLLAGAAKRSITPNVRDQTVFLAGDVPGRRARRVLDELWARALALRCGRETVVWVALDLLGLPYRILREVRRQVAVPGLPGEHVLVSCTRNHAGPDVSGEWQGGPWWRARRLRGLYQTYARFLSVELAATVREALAGLQPAQARLAHGLVGDVIGGASQRELAVAQFLALDGTPLAAVANYPLVPQILGPQNDAVSADFPYTFYQAFEGRGPRGPVALYACAEAREDPAPAFRSRSPREAARVGTALAKAVAGMLDGPSIPVERLRLWRSSLPVEQGRPVLSSSGSDLAGEVVLLELGPARLALLPGLIAPQVGREVRRMLDVPCRFVVGPANGDLGYLEPQEGASLAQAGRSLHATLVLDALDRLLLQAGSERS